MFTFKKVISPFLLPPGIFVLILIGSGIFLSRKDRKAGILNIAVGFLIWLLSIAPVSDALMRGLEGGLTVPAHPRGDVIILLGGGLSGNEPSAGTLVRIVAAVRLYKVLRVPVIVSAGAVHPWGKAEAPADARVLRELGVPAKRIILEDRSRDTLENARYSKEICGEYHFRRPVLVTSAYHMKRALMSFRYVKMHDVGYYPADLTGKGRVYGWADYLPHDLDDSSAALHEYLGLFYLKFFPGRLVGAG